MRIVPMGPRAVLVEDIPGEPAAWALGLRSLALAGVIDIVPAARTVLVRCVDDASMSAATALLGDVVSAEALDDRREVTIDVRYDGEDLVAVAEMCGVSEAAVVDLHSRATYTVAFCGFAPGFGYLSGLPPELHLPRRPSPRTLVPAGSVAIAAEYSAVYPRSSPGGWHLLGSTDVVLFDAAADEPTPLAPGTIVRFRVAT